jgi:hypothetical protein
MFADAPEANAAQELGVPHRFAPFFRRSHLDGYLLLSLDIDMDVSGLVAELESASCVVIGRVQARSFIVGGLPIEGRLLSA